MKNRGAHSMTLVRENHDSFLQRRCTRRHAYLRKILAKVFHFAEGAGIFSEQQRFLIIIEATGNNQRQPYLVWSGMQRHSHVRRGVTKLAWAFAFPTNTLPIIRNLCRDKRSNQSKSSRLKGMTFLIFCYQMKSF